jgi:DNA-binding transcriptional ArsR family regulator
MSDGSHADDAPEEVLALVGNETRAEILRVLGRVPFDHVSFSELRSRVDEGLDSGQFNYHLKQLVGQFVEQGDDGYTLTPEGIKLYRTLRAGTFTDSATVEPFDVGFDCYFCGTEVQARYEDGTFDMECPGCEYHYTHTRAPPSAVRVADEDDLLDRIDQYNRHEILAVSRGVCPICASGLDVEFTNAENAWAEGTAHLDVFVVSTCDHCGQSRYQTVGVSLLYDDALISFFHDHGVDVTAIPHWELEFAMTDNFLTVRSRDPWEVALSVTQGGETLELVVDESLAVVETTRS